MDQNPTIKKRVYGKSLVDTLRGRDPKDVPVGDGGVAKAKSAILNRRKQIDEAASQ